MNREQPTPTGNAAHGTRGTTPVQAPQPRGPERGVAAARSAGNGRPLASAQWQPAHRRQYASPWKIWLPIVILFVLADVTFNLWFWKIPKLTGDADWGYQFHIDLQRVSLPKPAGEMRVLAFGSSVSGGFDPHQVQSLLDASDGVPPVQIQRLLKPGIKPADYRLLFAAEGDVLHPDIAVITFNLLDFLNPTFERGFRSSIQESLPPWAVLREHYDVVPAVADKLDLALASVSNVYRYRKEIRSALRSHLLEAMHWLRAKPVHSGYGVYGDGYTQRRFGIPVDAGATVQFEYYVDPQWVRQRGRITLTFSMGGRTLTTRVEREPGWKTVQLDLPPSADRILHVVADSVWTPRAAGTSTDVRLLGVQLRSVPPSSAMNGKKPPYRYPPFDAGEIHPYLRMGEGVGEDFTTKWNEVLNSKTEFGSRFRAYRDAKLRVCEGPFAPTGEYAEMERLVAGLARRGTYVILVNTPESPWLLREYRDTLYYRGYLDFFRGLTATYRDVQFYDLSNALPPEDFNDWHHVNYVGGIKLGEAFADMVKAALTNVQRQRAQGT